MEGSGKSTLVAGLLERLRVFGVDVVATREPGGTELGDRVRAMFLDPGLQIEPVAEALLLNASRAQLVSRLIEPALVAGRWVLSDRFGTSTLAYQGYGRGVDLETLRGLEKAATRGLEPDLIFLIDIPVDVSYARIMDRTAAGGAQPDRLEREDRRFHARVRAGYLALAREDARIVTLDGRLEASVLIEAAWAELAAKRLT